jgi:photosystem II stability/assembly factor-like uncharacterized protein
MVYLSMEDNKKKICLSPAIEVYLACYIMEYRKFKNFEILSRVTFAYLTILFFFLLSCQKKETDNTQALMLLYCIQEVRNYVDTNPNFVRVNDNGSIYAGIFRPAPISSNVGPNDVTLAYSENGESFENRSNQNTGLIGGAVSYSFASNSLIYSVLGDWTVSNSNDGGKTWAKIYVDTTPQSFTSLVSGGFSYININADGKGAKFPISSSSSTRKYYDYTEDGGKSWTRVNSDLLGNQTITNISFKPNGEYFFRSVSWSSNASGSTANVLLANRTELTKIQDLMEGTNSSVSNFRFISNSIGYVINKNKLWKTVNGGTNWQAVTTTFTSDLRSFEFETEQKGWMIGGINGLQFFETSDGGSTWTQISLPFSLSSNSTLSSNAGKIAILSDKNIYTSKNLFQTYTVGNAGLKVLTTMGTNASQNPACIPFSL